MLSRLGEWALGVSRPAPWTNVYGVARSLIALGTALTLSFNDASVLFAPIPGAESVPFCTGLRAGGAFCVGSQALDPTRWLLVAALLVIASGWRPRWTALVHWWITWSVQANASLVEGGDQVAAILTLLLIPVALTDARRWHWAASASASAARQGSPMNALLAASALLVIRVQVAGIYFDSVLGKLGVTEWRDGTALYYWLTHPMFGAPGWLASWLRPLLMSPGVALLTWGVIALELALFLGLTLDKRHRGWLLVGGLLLHGGIMLMHGLVSFGLVMFAALILFLRPVERPFEPRQAWDRVRSGFAGAWRVAAAVRARRAARGASVSPARPEDALLQ